MSAVAITGVGVIAPQADSLTALCVAMNEGRSQVEDAGDPSQPAAASITGFDPRKYANIRGMRVYPRNTQLQICAATLALSDAGLEAGKLDPLSLGTITASTYAHLETLIEYDRGLVTLGIQRTNPTLFPLSLPSAPGALTALSLGAKAFAITLSDGDSSGLAALALGARLLAQGRAEVCVVTGAFTHCAELTLSAQRAGMLTTRERFGVFDRRSGGTVLGELAVGIVLEPAERARDRGQPVLGHVRGHAATFASDLTRADQTLARACRTALAASATTPEQLALVSAGASGITTSDEAEARALSAALDDARGEVPLTAPKALLGESLDASGLVQAATALRALHDRMAPAIVGLRAPAVPALRYLTQPGELAPHGRALLTSISHAGACSALVLSVDA